MIDETTHDLPTSVLAELRQIGEPVGDEIN
jgi:hypothetical protein